MGKTMLCDIPHSKFVKISGTNERCIIKIEKPQSNMQTDCACFEALAIAIKAKYKFEKLIIDFIPINWDGEFKYLCLEQTHYMRFLFRLWKFTEGYSWCEISEDKKPIVNVFKEKFKNAKLIANVPESASTFNPNNNCKEHILENIFLRKEYGNEYFKNLFYTETKTKLQFVENQFPNGLFNNKVEEKNRIFPTGYFDLWGINENNEFCLFELKKQSGNQKLGILSELFFYTVYASDVLLSKDAMPNSKKDFRGYSKIKEFAGKSDKVKAYFLVDKVHPVIADNKAAIIKILNEYRPLKLEFQFLEYDSEITNRIIDRIIHS